MRYVTIALLLTAPLLAGDLPKIKDKDARLIGSDIIKMTSLQSQIQSLKNKHDKEVVPVQIELNRTVRNYQENLSKLQEKYGVDEDCSITADLEWNCPEPGEDNEQKRDR